mmetsp:Transcript_4987/g.22267  ORF Transcript_4987/g.22267 Transcript_4987/m.22267 type:complete len:433 (-) Transcript_4987:32-1330(-)
MYHITLETFWMSNHLHTGKEYLVRKDRRAQSPDDDGLHVNLPLLGRVRGAGCGFIRRSLRPLGRVPACTSNPGSSLERNTAAADRSSLTHGQHRLLGSFGSGRGRGRLQLGLAERDCADAVTKHSGSALQGLAPAGYGRYSHGDGIGGALHRNIDLENKVDLVALGPTVPRRDTAAALKHRGATLAGVFTVRRHRWLRGDVLCARHLRLQHGGGWRRRCDIRYGFGDRFNGLGNGFGRGDGLLLLGDDGDLEFLCQARHVHADASSLEGREAEPIGLVLAELIHEVHAAGVDDAMPHRGFRLRPGRGDVLGSSGRLCGHRVAVDYTDTAADKLRSGGHEPRMLRAVRDTRVTPAGTERRCPAMRPDDGEVAHASHGVIFREISRRSVSTVQTFPIGNGVEGSPVVSWIRNCKYARPNSTSSNALSEGAGPGA